MTTIGLTVLFALLGAIFYRARGHDAFPRSLGVVLWSGFIALAAGYFAPPWQVVLVWLASGYTAWIGHADWQDWGHSPRRDEGEWANPLVRLFTARRDGALHDALGMSFSGGAMLAPYAVAAAVNVHPLAGLLVCGGVLKALAYAIAWQFPVRQRYLVGWNNGIGEVLTGALLYALVFAFALATLRP